MKNRKDIILTPTQVSIIATVTMLVFFGCAYGAGSGLALLMAG